MDRSQVGKRTNTIVSEWIEQRDKKELILSFEELGGTQEVQEAAVDKIASLILDGKEENRAATVEMMTELFGEGKLSPQGITSGLKDSVEFLEDIKIDAPMAVRNFAELARELVKVGGIKKEWVLEVTKEFVRDENNAKDIIDTLG